MLNLLLELLEDIKKDDYIVYKNKQQKIFALETAIEILKQNRKD